MSRAIDTNRPLCQWGHAAVKPWKLYVDEEKKNHKSVATQNSRILTQHMVCHYRVFPHRKPPDLDTYSNAT